MNFDYRIPILFVVVLVNCVFLLLFFSKASRRKKSLRFSIPLLAITGWALAVFLFYFAQSHALSVIWAKSIYFFGTVISIVFCFSAFYFFHQRRLLRVITAFSLVGIFTILYFSTGLIIADVEVVNGVKGFVYGPYRLLFDIPFLLFFTLGFFFHLREYKKTTDPFVRLQILYIIPSIFLGLLFAFVTNIALPWFMVFDYIWIGPIVSILLPLSITYAMLRNRLGDYRLVFKRIVVYALSLIFALLALFLFAGGIHIVADFSALVLLALYGVVAIVSFHLSHQFFTHIANRYVVSSIHERHEILRHHNQRLTSIINTQTLATETMQAAKDAFSVSHVSFFTRDENAKTFTAVEKNGFNHDKNSIQQYSALLGTLQQEDILLVTQEASPREKRKLEKQGIAVLLPFRSKGELIGFMLVGKKGSGSAYTQEDLGLLEVLALQVSLALDNAQLYEETQKFNETLQGKVQDQTGKIENLYKMKADLLDTVSHQLRTPTTAVRGMLDLLKDAEDYPKEKRLEMFEKLIQASDRLEQIIHDFLEARELQGGINESKFTTVDVYKLALSTVKKYRQFGKEKGISVVIKKPTEPIPEIQAHKAFLLTAFDKLVNNAAWYTEKGSVTVTVSLKEYKHIGGKKEKMIAFTVADTGIGLSNEDRQKLFKQFSKGRGGVTINVNSSGLGLFIVKEVALAHRGAVSVESDGVGNGSTFSLYLPITGK